MPIDSSIWFSVLLHPTLGVIQSYILHRLLDIEYFRYSILSNMIFDTVFDTFFKSADIDIEYSLLFWTGIDIDYSLLSDRYWMKSISILSNTLTLSFFIKQGLVNKKNNFKLRIKG